MFKAIYRLRTLNEMYVVIPLVKTITRLKIDGKVVGFNVIPIIGDGFTVSEGLYAEKAKDYNSEYLLGDIENILSLIEGYWADKKVLDIG